MQWHLDINTLCFNASHNPSYNARFNKSKNVDHKFNELKCYKSCNTMLDITLD